MKVTLIVIKTNARKTSRKYCSKLIKERNESRSKEKKELLAIFDQIQNHKEISIKNIDIFRHYCSYPLIDAILKQKARQMKEKKVGFSVSAVVSRYESADQTAVLAILMNLLDDAIDAAIKTSDPFVDIRIWTKSGYLIFKVRNTANNQPSIGSSTKEYQGHGVVLQIILQTCQKKLGNMQIENDEKNCTITATMQLEEEL